MKNIKSSCSYLSLIFAYILIISVLSIAGCNDEQSDSPPNSDDSLNTDQNDGGDTGDNTGGGDTGGNTGGGDTGGNTGGGDTGGNTGGGDTGGGNIEPTGTLTGTVDSALIADANCSASVDANAVYIYKANTVVAVDQSGSTSDPISIAGVSPDQSNNFLYSISVAEGIYTIAFTCQADLDAPAEAGDPVTFRGVTNVSIQGDVETTHDFTASNQSGGGLNSVIQQMPANSWYEVPNTHMAEVKADFPPPGTSLPGNINGLLAYSGAAYDSKRNRLILWGGGHANYFGNELYAFNITDFTWNRLTDPSPPTTLDVCVAVLSDGNPNSRHTYYNLDYIPEPVDRFFSTPGGSTSCNAGGGDPHTWMFDFIDEEWVDMDPTGTPVITWAPTESAYDPLTHKVFSVSAGGLYTYDVATNHWQKLNSSSISGDRGVVMDTKRNMLVVVGHGEVVVYDIGNENYQPVVWDTVNGDFNIRGYRPGVNYDPIADRIVVWDGGAVQALNMDTKEWTALAIAPQERYSVGTYGRFRYSPIENAYILINSANENVLIYKLTEGGGKQ